MLLTLPKPVVRVLLYDYCFCRFIPTRTHVIVQRHSCVNFWQVKKICLLVPNFEGNNHLGVDYIGYTFKELKK